MALTISTPYKTNTLASISGTRFISNGSPAFAGTTGRFIVMLDGPAAGQIRRVAATPAANEVTLDYPFSSGPFASLGFAEVDPVAGNTWVMSHQLEDIVDGTNVILSNGRIYIPFGNQVTFASGTFLAQVQKNFTFDSNSFLISNGAYCQFGHVSEAGNPYAGCYLEDTAGGSTGGFGGSSGNGGDCRFYACAIKCATSDFWRLYRDSNSKHHLVGCLITGNFGARIRGTRSIILNNTVDNDTSVIGPFHPATPVGLVSGLRVAKGQAGAYLNYGWPDALVKGLSTSEVSYYVQCAQTGNGTNASMYLEDFKQAEVESCALGAVRKADGFDSPLALVKFSNYIDTAIVDTSLANITDYARRVIRNGAGDTVDNTTSNTSSFARYIALRKTFNLGGAAARSIPWSEGIEAGPYVQGVCCYGYQPITLTLPLETSSDLTLTLLDDLNITEPVRATVQAYGSLANLDQLYDAYKSWFVTNFATPWPTFGAQKLTGQGTTLDCGDANIVVDGTAAAAFAANTGTNTITIKASVLYAGAKFTKLVTTGTISFANGATAGPALIYEDSTATSVPIVVSGVRTGTKCRIVRTDTEAELAIGTAGAAGFVARVSWATDLPIRADTTYTSGLDCEQEASALGTLTANGALLTVAQGPCTIYETNGRVGADVTGLVLDAPNVEADADEFDNRMAVQEFYAWYKHTLMSDAGIRTLFGAITAENAHKYRVNASKCPLKIDQKDMVNTLLFIGGLIYRDDGESIRLAGSGSIEMIPDDVYESASAEQSLAAIKAKTDNLPTAPAAVGDIPSATANASAVRTELMIELARIDATISSRNATAPDNASITAIKAKTDNLPAAPAAVGSAMTLAANAVTAAAIAADAVTEIQTGLATTANVTAATTSIKGVSDKDLTQVFNNTPSIDPSTVWSYATRTLTSGAAPSASQNADAVRTELATELARIDAAISSRNATAPDNAGIASIKAKTDNLPAAPAAVSDVPTAATNAAAVRTNLTTELARIDATISSRNATAPDNASIATIVSKLPSAGANIAGEGATAKNLDQVVTDPSSVWSYATRTLTSSSAPTAEQNADAVRTELATELARIDVAISTRTGTPQSEPPLLTVIGEADVTQDDTTAIVTADSLDATFTLDELST